VEQAFSPAWTGHRLLWPLVFCLFLTPLHAAGPYLFAYFIEPAKTGVYFALSLFASG
jgi:MFS-type transporter involved in bile tolerance (Atg22 family)